ncbi:EAL domain-containing protein [Marinimicrobium agarilyticum]|uniref:EAL domain-containing protein n=1 Tax=Marinimicrobium agarilyticum TaxID=306546 RepID=UPI000415DACF|nr:EAL domain-containing protein [Marinimicrobium agarilyticum]
MFWRFEPHPDQLEPLVAHHHFGLLALAVTLSVLAASTLLPVLERYRAARSARAGIGWVLAGALAMGCGVWSMHFTAMLAHRLPVPVTYDPAITLLSVFPIALGVAGTFVCARLKIPRSQRLVLASVCLGLGVGAMHYVGMEALMAPVDMRYRPGLFGLSVVLAVVVAWLGLASNLLLLKRNRRRWLAYLVGAVLLGLAVTSMHYVAMAATRFYLKPEKVLTGLQMDHQVLGALIAVAVVIIVALLLLAVMVDRRFSHIIRSLSSSERRFELLAETSESGIFTCDKAFDYINPAMRDITGYSEGELYQMPVADLLGFEPGVELARQASEDHLFRETFITTKGGAHRWLYITLSRLHGDGESRYLGSAFDITERKQMEQELRYLAFNDPLTDLPNRKFFMNRLNALMQAEDAQASSPDAFAVMFVDVNRFKLINDNFGLSKGDQLLKVIARRIKSALPKALLVSRVGGDEFALLFEGAARVQQVEREAKRLHQSFEQAFRLGEQEFFLSLSVGIAPFQPRYVDAEQLYRDATLAKDVAKREGPGSTCVFDREMHQSAQRHLELERDLRQALKDGAFELLYQPIVHLPGGELRGFEALVRWRQSDGTLVAPGEFIGLAEETGLINPLGDWVLREACRQIGEWRRAAMGPQSFYVSVNLSSVQFFQAGLITTVGAAVAQHGVQPGQLKLELTEGILVDDNPQVIERMQQLLDMGCGIMVDDFGTGYSSLSYLQRFPLEVLKIDQSFTAKLEESTGLHLVRAIISMAHALELGVIAEGIETPEVAQKLVELGCELGQGYHFARPLSAGAATEWLSASPDEPPQGALFQ